tara:strand:+ start:721 stop:846 length:126 start_codon:yes stop_codon:yes gene_type:complete
MKQGATGGAVGQRGAWQGCWLEKQYKINTTPSSIGGVFPVL